jgi:Protein of unknown function (DUF3916)
MRQIATTRKKLRGIPRRLRALDRWADSFAGMVRPRSDQGERFCNARIPVHIALVEGRQTNRRIQAQCVAAMLRAATHLSHAAGAVRPDYYRVACLFNWPRLHDSEVTLFYDAGYFAGFMREHNALAPRSLTGSLGLAIPDGFVECGCDITQPDDAETVELWCIGERI